MLYTASDLRFDLRGQTWGQKSISVNPGVIIGPDGKQLLLNKGEIRNPHDGEAFVGKYGEILDVGNGYLICMKHFHTPIILKDHPVWTISTVHFQSCSFNSLGHSSSGRTPSIFGPSTFIPEVGFTSTLDLVIFYCQNNWTWDIRFWLMNWMVRSCDLFMLEGVDLLVLID